MLIMLTGARSVFVGIFPGSAGLMYTSGAGEAFIGGGLSAIMGNHYLKSSLWRISPLLGIFSLAAVCRFYPGSISGWNMSDGKNGTVPPRAPRCRLLGISDGRQRWLVWISLIISGEKIYTYAANL
jgi:hypothetical protein